MSIGPLPAKATSDELSPLPNPANPAVRPKKPRCEVSHSVQRHNLKWRQSLCTADPMSVGRPGRKCCISRPDPAMPIGAPFRPCPGLGGAADRRGRDCAAGRLARRHLRCRERGRPDWSRVRLKGEPVQGGIGRVGADIRARANQSHDRENKSVPFLLF